MRSARSSTVVPCGSLGDAGCFSFFPNKNITTGEGGMAVFRDEEAAARARLLRSHGMTALTWDRHRGHATGYDVVEFGFNYRLDEPRAALGLVQLSRLDELNAARARLASRYRENLAGSPFPCPRWAAAERRPTISSSRSRRRPRSASGRASGCASSGSRRASTTRPIHRFSRYRTEGERLPIAEEIADRVITLPLHPS